MNKNDKIIVQINNIKSGIPEDNTEKSKTKRKKSKEKKDKKLNKKEKNIISNLPTKGPEDIKNKRNNKDNKNYQIKKINDKNDNINIININLNKKNSYSIVSSSHILNIYTFEEEIKYDLRSICKIFYIYLLAKQAFFHAFLYSSPLSLFPLRLCLLIFIISSDLALNAIFYFDDKISEKYKLAKSLFLFAFSNNLTVILLSTFIGFILLTLFKKLNKLFTKFFNEI